MSIRPATSEDAHLIATGFDAVAQHIRSSAPDGLYVSTLPSAAGLDVAKPFVSHKDGFAFVAERDGGMAVGVIACRLRSASVGWVVQRVGEISMAWVEPSARHGGTARALTTAAEEEFRRRRVNVVELAYVSGNVEAERTWAALGYSAFRVFAGKRLDV